MKCNYFNFDQVLNFVVWHFGAPRISRLSDLSNQRLTVLVSLEPPQFRDQQNNDEGVRFKSQFSITPFLNSTAFLSCVLQTSISVRHGVMSSFNVEKYVPTINVRLPLFPVIFRGN